jgi:ankyrin repeat protein
VRALLAHGADMSLPRGDGRTAYQIAVRHGNVAIAQLLREHGASTDGLQPMDMLIEAGAERDASINKWGEPPEGMASKQVAKHLTERVLGGAHG